ncbi:hypothetical protein ACNI3K_08005 [Demequina sp. SO4-13]
MGDGEAEASEVSGDAVTVAVTVGSGVSNVQPPTTMVPATAKAKTRMK